LVPQLYCADLFACHRGDRMKVLGHDGLGVQLAARRLHPGRFVWSSIQSANSWNRYYVLGFNA